MWWLLIGLASASEVFEGGRFYFGDIHAHTGASGDGGSSDLGTCVRSSDLSPADCGSVADLGPLAWEAELDFMATVDHVTSLQGTTTDEAFEQVYSLVNALNDPAGGFVTLPGAEIFIELPGGIELGHRSLLMFGRSDLLEEVTIQDLQPSGSRSNEVANCGVLSGFMEGLEARFGPALLIPHHPGVDKPMPTDWSCHDPRWAPVVEAYSEHGSSFDADSDFDPPWSGFEFSGTVLAALNPETYGHRLGLAGGTDNHDTHPGSVCRTETVLDSHPYGGGLTGVMLEGTRPFNRLSLYEAFRSRRTYTTTGPKVPLRFEVVGSEGTALAAMGDVFSPAAGADLSLELRIPPDSPPMVDSVIVRSPLRDWVMEPAAAGVYTLRIPAADRPSYVLADVTIDGPTWFSGGCEDGGDNKDHLWTSPIWIEAGPPADADADGFTVTDGDCDDTNPFIFPGAPEACMTPSADNDCDGLTAAEDPDCAVDTATPDTGTSGAEGDEREPVRAEDAPKSGCSAVGDGSAGWWLALWAVGLIQRRRSCAG